jgi:hypothetical protein
MFRFLSLAGALVLGACSPPPTPPAPSHIVAPADPGRRVAPLRVGNTTGGTRDFRVVGPRDWKEINRDIAPPTQETPR